jgi:type I restriction enzyme M protein
MNIKRTAEDAEPARTPRGSIWPRTCSGVTKEARWSPLQANAKQPSIGKLIDEAMAASEVANPGLKGIRPKDNNRPALDGCCSAN